MKNSLNLTTDEISHVYAALEKIRQPFYSDLF